jgi:hypothetical protein
MGKRIEGNESTSGTPHPEGGELQVVDIQKAHLPVTLGRSECKRVGFCTRRRGITHPTVGDLKSHLIGEGIWQRKRIVGVYVKDNRRPAAKIAVGGRTRDRKTRVLKGKRSGRS